jgi:hypothetical protein
VSDELVLFSCFILFNNIKSSCYYCFVLQDSINWVTIPARDRVAEVSLSVNFTHVMFGLAASSNAVSSGITWADCIHNINKRTLVYQYSILDYFYIIIN